MRISDWSSDVCSSDLFMDVLLEVKANYVEPVSDETLIDGAINGMLASLDPHSGYLDASDYSNLRTQTDGEYGGLGLSVTTADGAVKVSAATADSPADRDDIKDIGRGERKERECK